MSDFSPFKYDPFSCLLISNYRKEKKERRMKMDPMPPKFYLRKEEEKKETEGDNNGSHVIDVNEAWMNSMRERFSHGNSSHRNALTIYKIPQIVRRNSSAAYDPKMLAMGPYFQTKGNGPTIAHYHQGRRNKSVEEHKWRYLHDLYSRNPKSNFEDCINELKAMEVAARGCYSEDVGLNSNDFVELMVLDGCFILEYFLKRLDEVRKDPASTVVWMSPIIYHDLFLVENQIPFFILRRLFDLVIKDTMNLTGPSSVEELVILFLQWNGENLPPREPIHHLLHLLHIGLRPTTMKFVNSESCSHDSLVESKYKKLNDGLPSVLSPLLSTRDVSSSQNQPPQTILSATELKKAGVKFKKIDSSSFLDIKFSKGVMEIPSFYIHDGANSFFQNLIAFEQSIPKSETYITSYLFFVNCLIKTSKDVEILRQNGIIKNALDNDEKVVVLFNQLSKDIFIDVENNYLSDVFKEVDGYLKRDYFGNPWVILSLIAASVLLILVTARALS